MFGRRPCQLLEAATRALNFPLLDTLSSRQEAQGLRRSRLLRVPLGNPESLSHVSPILHLIDPPSPAKGRKISPYLNSAVAVFAMLFSYRIPCWLLIHGAESPVAGVFPSACRPILRAAAWIHQNLIWIRTSDCCCYHDDVDPNLSLNAKLSSENLYSFWQWPLILILSNKRRQPSSSSTSPSVLLILASHPRSFYTVIGPRDILLPSPLFQAYPTLSRNARTVR